MKVKKLREDAYLPRFMTEGSAGMDLAIPERIVISPNEVVKVGLGFAMSIESQAFVAIFPRSSMATYRGLVLANTIPVIDRDYRGEVTLALKNVSNVRQVINKGERVAQMVILPYAIPKFVNPKTMEEEIGYEIVNELDETERGDGGFGSTGND